MARWTGFASSTPIVRGHVSTYVPPRQTVAMGKKKTNKSLRNTGTATGTARRKNPPLTHFLCLPLVNPTSLPQVQHGLEALKKNVLANTTIPPGAVRPASTLHLTLGVMSLSPSQLPAAIAHLQALDLHAILRDSTPLCDSTPLRMDERPAAADTASEKTNATDVPAMEALTVDLQGLLPMHSPHDTSVLYVEPKDRSARLAGFALRIQSAFKGVGGLGSEKRELKLHGTVVNTIYAAKAMKTTRASENKLRFDARPLMDLYQDFVWAKEVTIDKVCICKMGAKKVWSSGVEGVGEVVDEVYEVVAEKAIME